jgi:hypothetical protein
LAIAGIKPSNDSHVSVSLDVRAGWIIDLSATARSNSAEQLKIIDAETEPSALQPNDCARGSRQTEAPRRS